MAVVAWELLAQRFAWLFERLGLVEYAGGKTLDELKTIGQFAPTEYLWAPRMPLGKVTVLFAPPGYLKTYISLDLSRRVVDGISWPLSSDENEPGVVLYIETEGNLSTVYERVRGMATPEGMARFIVPTYYRRPVGEELDHVKSPEWSAIEREIKSRKPRLVVFDSLTVGVSIELPRTVRSVVRKLARLAEKYRFAALLVVHSVKKSGATSGAYWRDMAGAAILSRMARSVLRVEGVGGTEEAPEHFQLRATKLNDARIQDLDLLGVRQRSDGGGLEWWVEKVGAPVVEAEATGTAGEFEGAVGRFDAHLPFSPDSGSGSGSKSGPGPDLEARAEVRRLRKEHPDWSQRRLAAVVGRSQHFVSQALNEESDDEDRWEQGDADNWKCRECSEWNGSETRRCVRCGAPDLEIFEREDKRRLRAQHHSDDKASGDLQDLNRRLEALE